MVIWTAITLNAAILTAVQAFNWRYHMGRDVPVNLFEWLE